MSWTRACSILALACAAASCDSALVDGSYHGEPLLVVRGEIKLVNKTGQGEFSAGFAAGELRLALMWLSPSGQSGQDLFMAAVEQSVSTLAVFPARYEVNVYQPPPPAAVFQEGALGSYALAVLAAYIDTNGNGTFDRDLDKLVGGATAQRVIVYSPAGVQAPFLQQPLAKGYQRMIAQGGGAGCKNGGRVSLAKDPQLDTEVKVFVELPATLFPDVNCDGAYGDFGSACPSPAKVAADCSKGKGDPWVCGNCPVP